MARVRPFVIVLVALASAATGCKRAEHAAAAPPPAPAAPAPADDEAREPDPEPDPADETDSEEADALFAKGVAAERAHKLADAARWFEEACGAGLGEGCGHLGEMYSDGRGVPADDRRAHELFEQGCALGSELACDAVGH